MLRHLIPVVAIILAGLIILFWWTPPCRLSPSDTAALERQLQGYDLLIAKASPEERAGLISLRQAAARIGRSDRCPRPVSLGLWINQVIPWPYWMFAGLPLSVRFFLSPAVIIWMLLGAAIYFTPTMLARRQRHRNRAAIFALNLLLGWTVVAWVIALVWALYIGQSTDES